ncbi:fasciclin domain-containing protein [Chitinophaga sp. 212800010-3]|uniref:fasciclin domain-containing protein n=1 Tax=unclassified Chitinophaga TaxID=2619133 RepID=UPI002DEAC5E0|nr:hypothetical protein [Chitinophaga sp. 212800010-3]
MNHSQSGWRRCSWLLLAGCLLAGACKKEVKITKEPVAGYFSRTKYILLANAGFSKFCQYLSDTGLMDSLSTAGPFTVMAPDDNAFSKSPYPIQDATLKERIGYHILQGSFSLRQLPLGLNQVLPAAGNRKMWVSKWMEGTDTAIAVNGCRVAQADMPTANGYVNILKDVMELEDHSAIEDVMKNDERFTFMSTALNRTGLFDYIRQNKDVTILAPDNRAFKIYSSINSMERVLSMDIDSLTKLVKHHLLPGKKFATDILVAIGTDRPHKFMMLDGTYVMGYTSGSSFALQSGRNWVTLASRQRYCYPSDDAVLYYITSILELR